MKKNHWALSVVVGAIGATSLTAAPAHAHISMKGALQSRGGDQKQSPCDGAKGDGMVYTFAPGATITLAVNEDIPHPSYFRVSFDNDGDDFVEPASIDPIDKTRACPYNADDQCGKSDYCTTAGAAKGAVVLWDNLDPHLQTAAKGGSWNIKLPDVECANCTLQVLQVMEDVVHGAYCPQGSCAASGASLEDIYHRCIDIKLVKGATNGPGASTGAVMNMGMECTPSAPAGAAGSGGAAAVAGSGGAAAGSGGAAAGSSAAGAGGASAAGTTGGAAGTAPIAGSAAGAPATSRAGAPAVSTGAGGAGAGAAGAGTVTSPVTGAGALAPAPTTPAPASDGGCSVVASRRSGLPSGMFTGTTLIALALFGARRRAGSRAGKRERAR